VLVPEKTEGASPLEGTAGTEDWLAFSLTRLALGHVVPHVTVDAHVLGHKLGATLLSCGADDFVGAQAAHAWAPPTDDGPRPLNPARVTKHVIEARRSPVRRDGIFRETA
jgi:2-iminoacetate synthase ThiH